MGWSLMHRSPMLEWLHSFLSLLLRILALHADGARLFLFQVTDEIGVVRILNCPTGLRHLACRGTLL
jgi:hypothetical protein